MLAALLLVPAFLVGGVLAGPMVARRAGVDLYEIGSGNPGATNVERSLGKRAGAIVLVLDAAKGWIVVRLASLVADDAIGPTAFALAVVAGHCFPAWAPRRGGKGVATAFGALAAVDPWSGAGFAATYLTTRRISGYGSVASLAAVLVASAIAAARLGPTVEAAPLLLLVGLVIARHAENLRRLARGEEPRADGAGG